MSKKKFKFEEGDIVRFRSGRRKMQVYLIWADGQYDCEWETEDGYETHTFLEHQLELVKDSRYEK